MWRKLFPLQRSGPWKGHRQPALLTAFPFWDLVVLLRPPIRYPQVVKQEEPEVPNKDPKKFQTLKLSAQSSSSVALPAIVTGPLTPKTKQMPVRRGDVPLETSIPTQPAYTTGRPIAMPPQPGTSTGPRQPPTPPPSGVVELLNRLAIRRRLSFGETVHSKLRHDCKNVTSRSGSRARKSWT